jgi:hypothetical protein
MKHRGPRRQQEEPRSSPRRRRAQGCAGTSHVLPDAAGHLCCLSSRTGESPGRGLGKRYPSVPRSQKRRATPSPFHSLPARHRGAVSRAGVQKARPRLTGARKVSGFFLFRDQDPAPTTPRSSAKRPGARHPPRRGARGSRPPGRSALSLRPA